MDDERRERYLQGFLNGLENLAFVKSTNSVTGEVTHLPPVIEDREATIVINGEFDREDLTNWVISRLG